MSKKPDRCFCCDPDWELCLDECSFTPFLFLQKQIIRAAVTPHSNMMTITVADTTAATISPLLELLLVSGGGEVLDTAGEGGNVETAALEDGLKLLLAGILESTAVARDRVVVGVVIGEETESVGESEAVRRALDVFQTESVENSSLVSKVVVVVMVLSLGRPTPADDIENGSGNEDTDEASDCTVMVKKCYLKYLLAEINRK